MERLTEWDGCNHPVINGLDDRDLTACLDNTECNRLFKAEKKLAEYEDLEEQGKLLKLPCAIGDRIYVILHNHEIREKKVIKFEMIVAGWAVITKDWSYLFKEFGKTVFCTKEEAEAALKAMSE